MSGAKTSDAQIIQRPNTLKMKVLGAESGPAGRLPDGAQERIRSIVQEYQALYPVEAERVLSRLSGLLGELKTTTDRHAVVIKQIRIEALDMMGQAETLDFPRLTWLARSLYDLCDGAAPEQQGRLLRVRVGWLERVIRDRVSGWQ